MANVADLMKHATCAFHTYGRSREGGEDVPVLFEATYAEGITEDDRLFAITLSCDKGERWENDVELGRDGIVRLHAFLTMVLALPRSV